MHQQPRHLAAIHVGSGSSCLITGLSSFVCRTGPSGNRVEILCENSIDLRSYAKSTPGISEAWGTMVCGAQVRHSYGAEDSSSIEQLWDHAVRFRARMLQDVVRGYQTIGLMAFISGPRKGLFDSLTARPFNSRNHTVALSNLGAISFPPTVAKFPLQGVNFMQSKCGEGPLILASILTCQPLQSMTISFSFLSANISSQQMDRFLETATQSLRACASSSQTES
eukprot:m.735178 g.735178  ORF g.735178 m.735178 type:complete len:224 (-) comp58889_c1_seq10:4087-4758(-)